MHAVAHFEDDIAVGDRVIRFERLERALAVKWFEHGANQKALCKQCPNFHRNLACPPFSPSFADYIGPARQARVICLRLPVDRFTADSAEEAARAAFRLGSGRLAEMLLEARRQGHTVAGSGECRVCGTCAAAEGLLECAHSDRRIYSLESLGVQVGALVKTCFNIELEWASEGCAAETISAVGAVFH